LANLSDNTEDPMIVGVGYGFQQLEEIKKEDWDIPLDAVVTDMKVIPISPRAHMQS
jgi:5-formyltetrahydrofolate cyclo-ligase